MSIILSDSISNFLSEIISNAPYHLLFVLFLQTAFPGNFFHKNSKSSLYFSFTYLIISFACSLLNISGVVHSAIIFCNSFSYSSLTFPTNSPMLSLISTKIYSSPFARSNNFEIILLFCYYNYITSIV